MWQQIQPLILRSRRYAVPRGILVRLLDLGILLSPICLVLALSGTSLAGMSSSEIETIQKAIDDSGASWIAAENRITRLTTDERRAMLGLLPEPAGTPERQPQQTDALAVAPASFSWGDKGGRNWMTSIKDQGGCGSCWGFGTAAAFEARERIRVGQPNLFIDISEQNMVSCWKGDCDGANGTWVMDMFQTYGAPDEACFPYVSGSGAVPPCENRCADWAQRAYFVSSHGYWYKPSIGAMKNEILINGPIQISLDVYEDFYAYSGGVYEYVTGDYEGGHMVVFYGWDDANNCWLVKNSWGANWGEIGPNGQPGWFRIRMGTNEVNCETWVYYLSSLGLEYPQIVSTSPLKNEQGASASANITVTFDTDMDPTTISASTMFVNGSISGPHPGTVSYDGPSRSAVIDPAADFLAGELVSVVMTPEVTATGGLWLNTGYTWSFTSSVNTGTGAFDAPTDYSTDQGPLAMCSDDLNGDGYSDFVSANAVAGNLSVRLGSGDGTFGAAAVYTVGNGPRSVTAPDLDGDGYLDLAVVNSQSHMISVLANNGDGTFAAAFSHITITNPRFIVAADFDADGDPDLVTASQSPSAIRIHLNDGTGSFTDVTQRAVAASPFSLAVGDLDDDGDFDVAYVSYSTGELVILWNDGPGTFDSESHYPVEVGPRWVAVSDVNGDALLDPIVANFSSKTVSVMVNNGNDTFTSTSVSTAPLKPESVCAADLNGDGYPDIAAYGSTGICVLVNNGDGTFGGVVSLTSGSYLEGLAADFDGDDDLDLASVSYSEQKVSVLLNLECVDSDGDGFGDPGSLAGVCLVDNCPSDYNLDQADTDEDGVGDVCDLCPGYDDNLDADGDLVPDGCDNCPDDYNPNQVDTDGDDIGDVCDGCCEDRVGDANGLGGDEPTIGDISVMIDAKFITGTCEGIIECLAEADINQSGGLGAICDDITISDISILIDYLFITGQELGLAECL